MKACIILGFFFLTMTLGCGQRNTQPLWLLGAWDRVDLDSGQIAWEYWKPTAPDAMAGEGITLSGEDTSFYEKLSIRMHEGKLSYVAEVDHNETPTYFEITDMTENSFVCQNPDHDFPKKITYELMSGDTLKVSISDHERSIPFLFRKRGG